MMKKPKITEVLGTELMFSSAWHTVDAQLVVVGGSGSR